MRRFLTIIWVLTTLVFTKAVKASSPAMHMYLADQSLEIWQDYDPTSVCVNKVVA